MDLPRSRRLPRRAAARRADLSAERGSILFEALVSMVLLVIFSLGFLGAVDTSSSISGNNEARTAASALAQEDIERVKALKIRDLANMNVTRTVPVGGVNYSVTTTTQWVDDSTGHDDLPVRRDPDRLPEGDLRRHLAEHGHDPAGQEPDADRGAARHVRRCDGRPDRQVHRPRRQRRARTSPSRWPGRTTSSGTSDADGCAFWSGLPEGGYYVNVAQPGLRGPGRQQHDPPERHRHGRLDELVHLLLRPRGDHHRDVRPRWSAASRRPTRPRT